LCAVVSVGVGVGGAGVAVFDYDFVGVLSVVGGVAIACVWGVFEGGKRGDSAGVGVAFGVVSV
jgi:hypothetical protein